MIKKKKGILVWFEMDRRPELLQPFIEMSDEIEFVHLFFSTKEERDVNISPFKVIYWFDYKTPYSLLEAHQPDFIIGATEVIQIISLIVAAAQKKIPYYGLQHGFSTDNFLSTTKKVVRENIFSLKKIKRYYKIVRFYFGSLTIKSIGNIFQYINLFIKLYSNFAEVAINKTGYKWLIPYKYLCFSEIAALHYKNIYNLTDNQIQYIGIPCFDNFYKELNYTTQQDTSQKYFILIDNSFIDYFKPITQSQIDRCYTELKEYCKSQNALLYIKLHPRNYNSSPLISDETIRVVKNLALSELKALIVNSQGCFSFFSTLMMPIAFIKPTIQIRFDDIYDSTLAENNITPVVDFYNFVKEDIEFADCKYDEDLKNKFLYATDGNSASRIKKILLNS
jgi:hypothetical protein